MRKRMLIPLAGVAVALLVAGTGVALAADAPPTGPDTTACSAATTAVTGAQSKVDAQVALVAVTQSDLEKNTAFLNAPETTATAKPYFQAQVDSLTALLVTQKATVVDLGVALTAAAAAKTTACAAAPETVTPTTPPADPTVSPTTAPTVAPTTVPTTPPAAGPLYATCAEASAAGVFDIPAGAPGYRAELDSDTDGVACERPAVDGSFDQIGTVPVGSVDTGGGPA